MNVSLCNKDLHYQLHLKIQDEPLRDKLITSGEEMNKTRKRSRIVITVDNIGDTTGNEWKGNDISAHSLSE